MVKAASGGRCWLARRGWGGRRWLAAQAAVLMLMGCGAAGTGVAARTTTGSRAPRAVVRTASAQSAGTGSPQITQTVSCQPGEQMIGGGFSTGDVFEYAVFALADYPSGPASWTVTAGSISHFALIAEVYCVPASPPLDVQIAHAGINGAGTVACPAGTTVLGGGFSGGEQAAESSRPASNGESGWYAAVAGASARVYALCAGQRVSMVTTATATFNPHSNANGEQAASDRATCPASATATGGGFDGSLITASGIGAPADSAWSVEAGGNSAVTIYAVCVDISG